MDVAAIQESNLTTEDKPLKIPGYTCYRRDRQVHRGNAPSPHGGLLLLVKEGIHHDAPVLSIPGVPPGAALETMSTTIHAPRSRPLQLINMYRPPGRTAQDDQRDTDPYTQHWPTDDRTFIFADLNGHGGWDHHLDPDDVGEQVEEWLADSCWNAINDGSATRIAPNGALSAPDATLCHASWSTKTRWSVMDTIGSDHLPILVDIELRNPPRSSCRGPAKYSLRKTNWEQYQRLNNTEFEGWDISRFSSLDEAWRSYEKKFLTATKCVPKGSLPKPKGWWSDQCRAAKSRLIDATSELISSPDDPEAMETYRTARRSADKVYADERTRAWQEFASTLDVSTPTARVWNVMRSLDGRGKAPLGDTPIREGNKVARTDKEKANLTMKTYAQVSRVTIKREDSRRAYEAVRSYLRSPEVSDDRSLPFSTAELEGALASPGGKASGPDNIHPLLIRKQSPAGKKALLDLLNRSWAEGRVPSDWKKANIVPILKKNKAPDSVRSYRPVSLLSCVSKVLEALVGRRLERWAEEKNLLPDTQAGFRKGRSTTDCLTRIVQRAFDNLNNKKMVRTLVTAVDFEAAFDRVWRGGLLSRLAGEAIPHHWLRWLRAFLTDRRARVRWNTTQGSWRTL